MSDQPVSIDTTTEIPKGAPLGAGQTREQADALIKAQEEFKAGVKAEKPELGGPRDPGDHATGKKGK